MANEKLNLSSATLARLAADSKGHDIVGLKKDEPFDPIGDMDRAIEAETVDEAIAEVEAESPSSPVAQPAPMVLPADAPPKVPGA